MEHRLPVLGVVERLVKLVEAIDVLIAPLARVDELRVPVPLQERIEVVLRRRDDVDLAGLQSTHRGLLVGHGDPLDTIDLGDLASARPEAGSARGLYLGFLT